MVSLVCPVLKLMSLIGLLTAAEKQVHLGRLHMRPIQWHLKNNQRVPEHALQFFTGASKEGWGAHVNEHTARGDWSFSESKLHINHLEPFWP